jgi:hypothetical protein
MSCGDPNTNRDEQLARQLQREEYNISSNSNLAKKYQEVYDKEANIYGFDPVFDIDGNKNLANKIRAAERNNLREDDIDLIFQKHANERRKFLAKSEKINEKIIDKPLPKPVHVPKPNETKSIFIDFSQTILDLTPFIFLFIIIVFLYYSSNNKKGKRK